MDCAACSFFFSFPFNDWLWNKKTNTLSLNLAHTTPRKANITRDPQLQRVTQILHGSTWQRRKTFWPRSSALAEPKHFSSWGLHSKIPHKWRELSPFGFCISHSKHLRKCWYRQLASRGSIKTFHQIKNSFKDLNHAKIFQNLTLAILKGAKRSRVWLIRLLAALNHEQCTDDGSPRRLTSGLITLMQVARTASCRWRMKTEELAFWWSAAPVRGRGYKRTDPPSHLPLSCRE